MSHEDQFGVAQMTGDSAAVRYFDTAVSKFLIFNNDPLAEVDKAIAIDPGFRMAQVLKGLLCLLGTEKAQLPVAKAALRAAKAQSQDASAREKQHLAALEAWTLGRLKEACAIWENILIEEPRDVLAMLAAHHTDFFLGNSIELRDRIARRLPSLDKGSRLAGYYQGMYAFGLEETGDYARAEQIGCESVAADSRNAWAIHAVAHVFEMTQRIEDGQRWLTGKVDDWFPNNFFAVHLWWHLALYSADQQHWDEVLGLYDSRIRATDSAIVLDMVDASSLLWRLLLQGIDVGNRWQRMAEVWEPRLDDGWYAFNDLHAMMAFAGAGRRDLVERLLKAMHAAGAQTTDQSRIDNGLMTRTIGLPVATALAAFVDGRYAETIDLLLSVKAIAVRAGGSHAQRDVIAQTLIVAAEKSGRTRLARALLNERLELKPHSGINLAWQRRLDSAGRPDPALQ